MTTVIRANAAHVVREWFRSITELVAKVGGPNRINVGRLPGSGKQIVVARGGGGADATGLVDEAVVVADCWADSETEAWDLAGLIVDAAEKVRCASLTGAILDGVFVQSALWQPDDTDRPRYVVTMQATIRSV